MQLAITDRAATSQARQSRMVATALVVALTVWFAAPALFAEYNEGFQTTIVVNARALLAGRHAGTDLLYPLDDAFFFASRLGVSLLIAGLLKLGIPSTIGFRLIMAGSLLVLLAANASILVRRYAVPPWLALAPSLLVPGIFESAWFFNDNVLSAACSSAALALFWHRPRPVQTAGAALLWSLAILCRTDAVLLGPAFVVLGWFELPTWRARLTHAAVAAPIVLAVPWLTYHAVGLDIIDVLSLTRRATEAWARKDRLTHILHPAMKGIAYPGMVLAAAGVVALLRKRAWWQPGRRPWRGQGREILLCLVVPLLYTVAYGKMLTEVRYLLPLTPFIGILMVLGARLILGAGQAWRRAGIALFAATAALGLLPPLLVPVHRLYFLSSDNDMIRPTMGRLWSPLLGLWWNGKLHEGAAAAQEAVLRAAGPNGAGIVVSTRWTPDRLTRFVLAENGFTGERETTPAACAAVGERYTRGPEHLLHLRAHIPMLPTERSAITWRRLVVPCLDALGVAADAPILVVGQMLLTEPPPGLSDPAVRPIYVPQLDVGPLGRSVAGKAYATYVAMANRAVLPEFLFEPKDETERVEGEATIAQRSMLQ